MATWKTKRNARPASVAITNETYVAGEDESGRIFLNEAPDPNQPITVSVGGSLLTRVTGTPTVGQYAIITSGNLAGMMILDPSYDRQVVSVSYHGMGSTYFAADINRLQRIKRDADVPVPWNQVSDKPLGVAGGVATLGPDGILLSAQRPPSTSTSGGGSTWPSVLLSPYNWKNDNTTDSRAAIDATPAEELQVVPGDYVIRPTTGTPGLSDGVQYGVFASLENGQVFGTYPNNGVQFVRPFYDGQTVMFTGVTPGGINTTTRYFVVNSTPTTFQVSLTKGGPPVVLTSTVPNGEASLVHLAHDLRIKRGAVLHITEGAMLRVDPAIPLGGVQIDCEIHAGLFQWIDALPGQVIWHNGKHYDIQNSKGTSFGEGAIDMWWGAQPNTVASHANRRACQAALDAHTTAMITGPVMRVTGPLYVSRGDQLVKSTLPGGVTVEESFGGGPIFFSTARHHEEKWTFRTVPGITTDGGFAMPIGKVPDGAKEATYLDLSTLEAIRPFLRDGNPDQRRWQFEMYLRTDAAPVAGGYEHIVHWGGRNHAGEPYTTYFEFAAIDSNRYQAKFTVGGTTYTITPPTTAPSYAAGDVGVKRNHLALSYDAAGDGTNGKLRFFINGALIQEINTPLNEPFYVPPQANFVVGHVPRSRYFNKPPDGQRVHNGVVDSLRIMSAILYTAPFTPPTGKLQGWPAVNSVEFLLNFDVNERGFTAGFTRGTMENPRGWLFGYNASYSFFGGQNRFEGITTASSRAIGLMMYQTTQSKLTRCNFHGFIGLHLFNNCWNTSFYHCTLHGTHAVAIIYSENGLITFADLIAKGTPRGSGIVMGNSCSAIVTGKNFEVGRFQFHVYESGLDLHSGTTTDEGSAGVKGSILAGEGAIINIYGGNLETATADAQPVIIMDGNYSLNIFGGMVTRHDNATEVIRQVQAPQFPTKLYAVVQRRAGGGMLGPAAFKQWSATPGAVQLFGTAGTTA